MYFVDYIHKSVELEISDELADYLEDESNAGIYEQPILQKMYDELENVIICFRLESLESDELKALDEKLVKLQHRLEQFKNISKNAILTPEMEYSLGETLDYCAEWYDNFEVK